MVALGLSAAFLAASCISLLYIPESVRLFPAVAVSMAALYFGGWRLSPLIFLLTLLAAVIAKEPLAAVFLLPISVSVQSFLGAFALRGLHVDALFRRRKDISSLIIVVAALSAISAAFWNISALLSGSGFSTADWAHAFIGSLCSYVIFSTFILRWVAKFRFKRVQSEMLETAGIFLVLFLLESIQLFTGLRSLLDIPITYLALVPLTVIALRLRPRFLTLALTASFIFVLTATVARSPASGLEHQLYAEELTLAALGIATLLLSSLAEELRVTSYVLRSQLAILENAVTRVRGESQAKNDFVAILAHELRNPLAPISYAIELMKLKGTRDAEDIETFDMITDRIETIRRLLDDLLDSSRISEGKIVLERSTVDLAEILRRSIISTEHHRRHLHQKITFKAVAPAIVYGDPVRLEQIFSNLLTNASKYSNPGDTVTVRMRSDDPDIEVVVEDQGVGLDAAMLDSIFTPFQQIEQGTRTRQGLGIGLSLVRSFVEMHNGTVKAMSEGLGRGSRFVVRIPYHSSGAGAEMPGARARQDRRSLIFNDRPLVLVAHRDDVAAGSIGKLLEYEGCGVAYALNSDQAITQADELSPAAILVEIDLPPDGGAAVARAMREHGSSAKLIAVVRSMARWQEFDNRSKLFDGVLLKPIETPALKSIVSTLR